MSCTGSSVYNDDDDDAMTIKNKYKTICFTHKVSVYNHEIKTSAKIATMEIKPAMKTQTRPTALRMIYILSVMFFI